MRYASTDDACDAFPMLFQASAVFHQDWGAVYTGWESAWQDSGWFDVDKNRQLVAELDMLLQSDASDEEIKRLFRQVGLYLGGVESFEGKRTVRDWLRAFRDLVLSHSA